MGQLKGCFKNGCLGCLGLILLSAVLLLGGTAVVRHQTGAARIEEQVLGPGSPVAPAPVTTARPDTGGDNPDPGQGWVVLDLSQGEFHITKGAPGQGVVVKARYDVNTYELQQYRSVSADSSWVYQMRFRRTTSGWSAMLQGLFGEGEGPVVQIELPPDVPLELDVLARQGGLEADLGGLWLTNVDLRYDMGGIELEVSEPLRDPLDSFVLIGRMGGAEITSLGNASPRHLTAHCRMGGLELDLGGAWRTDCDAEVKVSMGGLEVVVPDNIRLETPGIELSQDDAEMGLPVLRLRQIVEMGEIEIK